MGVTAQQSDNGQEVTVSVAGRFDYRVYDSFRASYSGIEDDNTQINVDLSETD